MAEASLKKVNAKLTKTNRQLKSRSKTLKEKTHVIKDSISENFYQPVQQMKKSTLFLSGIHWETVPQL